MSDSPRLEKLEASARHVAEAIDMSLQKHGAARRVGFFLWLGDLEPPPGEIAAATKWGTYISNIRREDVIASLKELTARLEDTERQQAAEGFRRGT